jgi:DnaJ-class molecular chaperone
VDAIRAYATLGVADTASWADLRRAYREQLQLYHPDTGAGDVRALQSVTSAYRELRDARPTPTETVPGWPVTAPPVGGLVDLYA